MAAWQITHPETQVPRPERQRMDVSWLQDRTTCKRIAVDILQFFLPSTRDTADCVSADGMGYGWACIHRAFAGENRGVPVGWRGAQPHSRKAASECGKSRLERLVLAH